MRISKGTHREVYAHFSKLMKRERVAITQQEPKDIEYLCAYTKNSKLVGCVAYQIVKGSIRYKTDYVLPNYRGNGIYSALFQERDKMCKDRYKENVYITAYCTNLSIGMYLKNGFCVKSENSKGIKFVTRGVKQDGTQRD